MATPAKAELAARIRRLRKSLEREKAKNAALAKSLAEAVQRQAAAAEILKVISRSPADPQPVFDAIARSARRLFGAHSASIARLVDGTLHLAALTATTKSGDAALKKRFPVKLAGEGALGKAILSGRPAWVVDFETDLAYSASFRREVRERGYRSLLAVPMIREGIAIGGLAVTRRAPGRFTDQQIRLLQTFADQAVIAIENVHLFNETKEALEHQKASADILRVISSSPTDLSPVMAALAESAARLCEATDAHVWQREGDDLQLVASYGPLPIKRPRMRIGRDSVTGRAVFDCELVHVHDLASVFENEFPNSVMMEGGYRSVLAVPLVREGGSIGAILIRRTEVRPFTPKQLALLQTFADQAVIAIENVRLFNETKETLERETATSELLKVIGRSTFDLQPVFDTLAENAVRLCEARQAFIFQFDGQLLRVVASCNASAELRSLLERNPIAPGRGTVAGRTVLDARTLHIHDVRTDPESNWAAHRVDPIRTVLTIPMIRAGEVLGVIGVNRHEVRPFTDKQITLLETFADQAAIAIENVRLFNETKEALERQTATAEILKVIASSPSDVQPVFDAIVRSALRLINGYSALVALLKDDSLHLAAFNSLEPSKDEALTAIYPVPLSGTLMGDAVSSQAVLFISNTETDPRMREVARESMRLRGVRSFVVVPLIREGVVIGTINVSRTVTGPFSDHEIGLLTTFADQAVIAIENVRLFNETKEALERQTATSEVLKTISRSTFDLNAVLQVLIENATRLAGASQGFIFRYDGEVARMAFSYNAPPEYAALIEANPIRPGRGTLVARTLLERQPVHIPDVLADSEFTWHEAQRLGGFRSMLGVPMMREGNLIGVIAMWTTEVRPFTEKQIELVSTFADQAVIAIENVRLFNETKEALERQTATAEILKVIASSPTDVQPVFETILENAVRLCDSPRAVVCRFDGRLVHLAATKNWTPEALANLAGRYPQPPDPRLMIGRVILTGKVAQIEDATTDPSYPAGRAAIGGWRRMVGIPMLREGTPIGAISVTWPVAGKTPERQIELLRTFADQAVIAIENVRLFNETKEALERQTATAEILRVIGSSLTDTRPVFDAIVQSALRLFNGHGVAILLADGDRLQLGSAGGIIDADVARGRFPLPLDRNSLSGHAILDRSVVNIADSQAADAPEIARALAVALDYRAIAVAPMLREGGAVGAILVMRSAAGALSEKELALLRTFADQAVIAIENVRLFNETKEALDRQTATADVLRAISTSPTDTRPVFEAILERATKLCGAETGILFRYAEGAFHALATRIPNPEFAALFREPRRPTAGSKTGLGQIMRSKRTVHIPDIVGDAATLERDPQRMETIKGGMRSWLGVPLLKEGELSGAIVIYRSEPLPFSPAQIALVETFAEQSVIAIENVRLFNETKEALEQQTGTAKILSVISSSPTDIQPVLDAVAESAARLCGASDAVIRRVEADGLRIAAHFGELPTTVDVHPITRGSVGGRAVIERRTVHIEDIGEAQARAEYPDAPALQSKLGYRTLLAVPLMREGEAIGVIVIRRMEVRPFSDKQIRLVETFAAQSVIAIENVRLFNETKEALERQTATAEILRVIGGSLTDTQPVFDAIVSNVKRLFAARYVGIFVPSNQQLEIVAFSGEPGFERIVESYPRPLDEQTIVGKAMLEKRVLQLAPIGGNPETPPGTQEYGRKFGYDSIIAVPLMREGNVIGGIGAARRESIPFDDRQVGLIKSFADQAVIAIENVRLFKELQARTEALTKSVGQLTALGEVGQAISSTLDLETVLKTIVQRAVQLTGLDSGAIYEYDESREQFTLQAAEKIEAELVEAVRRTPIRKGDGATGRIAVTLEAEQVPDIDASTYHGSRKDVLVRSGYRAVLAVPLLREDHLLGALQVFRRVPGPFAPEVVELLETFATQSAMAIQNARLFREIAEKGKQLEVASQHKSQFLASMSHELRTPLNALLGFNEMLLGEVYGEVPADMQPPLAQMQASGRHLLRLINNVLDLAKIEAGRMELALSDYSVADTVESVRSTLTPLAADKGLDLLATVPADIPLAYGDPGRITQCLMNLAGNSLKFTKAGKVEISVVEIGGILTYRVSDTGIGIPPDKIDTLFTEFKQTDATIASEYGGTGLGLSISKKFVEMHGGRIWVESEPEKGSTFTFEIPLRAGEGKSA